MPKITKAQAAALALIEDHPGRVEAVTRLRTDLLHVNGNLEHRLRSNGWVAKVDLGEHRRVAFGLPVAVWLTAWKLTEAGREALRSTL